MITDEELNAAATRVIPLILFESMNKAGQVCYGLIRNGDATAWSWLQRTVQGAIFQLFQSYMACACVIKNQDHETSLVELQKWVDEIFTPERMAKIKAVAAEEGDAHPR